MAGPPRRRSHVTREILGEARAGLDAEQVPKINVPVLLVTGELQLFRLKVEPLASQGCSLQQWINGAAVPCRAGVGDKRHLLPVFGGSESGCGAA
jgi:hypothetical protein